MIAQTGTRIALVAGEMSGDLLGAGLIQALKEIIPNAQYEGVAGKQMVNAGCFALDSSERLSVMGLVEVVAHLPALFYLRRRLVNHWSSNPPDVFIGIDAPEFNLGLEQRLRDRGIPTIHYVSPSVWAWRPGRIRKIQKAVDLMLTLFPFESDFYAKQAMPAKCVGHPLADILPLTLDRLEARRILGLPIHGDIVALLPGSRQTEVSRLAQDFFKTAQWLTARRPEIRFILPLATKHLQPSLTTSLIKVGHGFNLTILEGQSHLALTASDVALVASGTAALEALLINRPMVVAYRISPLSYTLIKPLMQIPFYSLPNLLASRQIVPEFIQSAVTPEALGQAVLTYLINPKEGMALKKCFNEIHSELRRDASHQAAKAIFNLLEAL